MVSAKNKGVRKKRLLNPFLLPVLMAPGEEKKASQENAAVEEKKAEGEKIFTRWDKFTKEERLKNVNSIEAGLKKRFELDPSMLRFIRLARNAVNRDAPVTARLYLELLGQALKDKREKTEKTK